ncbi:unannotated protein [freshwater metagenome]|uniref:Unannotated protein n=1 Tax=freshwater metagenome TaxID=449393 RepID=A0A6J6DGR0_9ZZZZ
MVHTQTSDLLEETQNFFAFTPAVQHHGNRTKVHSICREEQQMATHAIQFGQQHAHPHGTFRDVLIDTEKLFHRHRENKFVIQWRQVVHARHIGAALHVSQGLTRFLHARVQVTNDGLATKNGFALKFKHQTQHTVSTGVLRAHVDDHGLIFWCLCLHLCQRRGIGFTHAQN